MKSKAVCPVWWMKTKSITIFTVYCRCLREFPPSKGIRVTEPRQCMNFIVIEMIRNQSLNKRDHTAFQKNILKIFHARTTGWPKSNARNLSLLPNLIHDLNPVPKDKSWVGTTVRLMLQRKTHHLLTRILTVVSHFELSSGCQIQKCLII